jgi:hypothetical protein
MLTLTLDVVDQLFGGVGRLHSAFVPFDWLLKKNEKISLA